MNATHLQIFVAFMIREGFTAEFAIAEFDFITAHPGDYLTASRIGLAMIGSRAVRRSVLAAYENAANHATFSAA